MIDEVKKEDIVEAIEAQPEPEVKEAPKVESNKEYNLRALRERAEKAEHRAAELERMQQYQQPKMEQKLESNDEDFDIDDESYVEGKSLKKYLKSIKSELKQTLQITKQQAEAMETYQAEAELNARYPDAKEVLTDENLRNLAAIYPQDYRDIMSTPSLKTRAKLAYLAIKNQDIGPKFTAEDKRIAENKTKPRSAASVPSQAPDTPLGRLGDYDRRVLSDARKDEIMRSVRQYKNMR